MRQLRAEAQSRGLRSSVLTLRRVPTGLRASRAAARADGQVPSRLHTLREKSWKHWLLQVERNAGLSFDAACRARRRLRAHRLVDAMRAKHVMIGDDFRFGARAPCRRFSRCCKGSANAMALACRRSIGNLWTACSGSRLAPRWPPAIEPRRKPCLAILMPVEDLARDP